MKLIIKDIFKNLFSFLGLKITRTHAGILISRKGVVPYSFSPSDENKLTWIQALDIKTILDVGAHKGEFASQFHNLLPNAKIYSFEPLHENFIELNTNLKDLPNFKAFNLAIGDKKGEIEMYHNEFSPSSSIRKIASLHKEIFPFTSDEELEKVEINTLDEIAQELDLEDNVLLKIDVQGYEDKVIMGARKLLSTIKIIIVETSFRELYEGQALFADIYKLLDEQGFIYSGSFEELKSPIDGTPLQQDSLFIKE